MRIAIVGSTLALLSAALPGTAFAADLRTSDRHLIGTIDVLQQRKDVQEITIPQPRTGPATPIPLCSPGQPICF